MRHLLYDNLIKNKDNLHFHQLPKRKYDIDVHIDHKRLY